MNYDKLLQTILDIGEEMIVAGAEVSRVEESVFRMCKSYGCDRINAYILLSNMQVTVETPDEQIITHIRYMERSDVNFDRLDYLNDLSRYICANLPEVDEMKARLEEVMNRKEQSLLLTLSLGSQRDFLVQVSFSLQQENSSKIGRASVGKECRSRWSPYH